MISSCRALQPRREVVKSSSKGELLKGTNFDFRWMTVQLWLFSLMFMEAKRLLIVAFITCFQHLVGRQICLGNNLFHFMCYVLDSAQNQDAGLALVALHIFQFCTCKVRHPNVILTVTKLASFSMYIFLPKQYKDTFHQQIN